MTTMNVPLLDLKPQYAALREEIDTAVREVIESQYFILGPKVVAFEEAVAEYCGTKYAVGCASGSDAILLALMALDIKPGDEVICPSYTFFATAGYIVRAGGTPVFAEIDPVTFNLDPAHVKEVAESCTRLKAIMPVHLYGQACDLDALIAIGNAYNVPVIEDAAQAIGCHDSIGTVVGSRGLMGCFSFFPTKNLGAFGDAGAVTTNDAELANRMKRLRMHGMEPKYYHQEVGVNSRLDALQAAVLHVKLRYLESWHAARQRNATQYDAKFHAAGAVNSETPLHTGGFPLRTPYAAPTPARHIYNQYIIRVPADHRDQLRAHLLEQGVGTEIYYPLPLHLQECFKSLGNGEGDFPESERAALETLALPIYPDLTAEQIDYAADTIIAYLTANVPAAATA